MTPPTPYARGADKERRIVNAEKKKGHIAFRSAGSHSPIDVVSIDKHEKKIRFIQSKGAKEPEWHKRRLEREQFDLWGMYLVTFEVI